MKKKIIIFSGLLLLVNLVALFFIENFYCLRALRVVTSVSFFCISVVTIKRWNILILVPFFLMVSDIGLLRFRELFFDDFMFITSSLAFIITIIHLYPKVKIENYSYYVLLIFALMIATNIYLIKEVVSMTNTLDQSVNSVLLIIISLSLLVNGVLSALYNYHENSTKSLYCVGFVFCFILCYIFDIIAHNFHYIVFQFANLFFYIIGFSLFYSYILETSEGKNLWSHDH